MPVLADAEQQHVEVGERGVPGPGRGASSSAYRAAAASGSLPAGPSEAGIGCTRAGSSGTTSSSAARAWVSLRSGSPAGRNRSSPHQTSTRDQSTASRAGSVATARYTAAAIRPPVSTTDAWPRSAWASSSFTTSRAATACGQQIGVGVDGDTRLTHGCAFVPTALARLELPEAVGAPRSRPVRRPLDSVGGARCRRAR